MYATGNRKVLYSKSTTGLLILWDNNCMLCCGLRWATLDQTKFMTDDTYKDHIREG